jgi:hypothetical protein
MTQTVRPRDYFDMLSPARQSRFLDNLREFYAIYAGRQLADDCAQIAMLFVLKYRYALEIGPSLGRERTPPWFAEAHSALLRFVKVRRFRGAVLRAVYKGEHRDKLEDLPLIEQAELLEDENWDACGRAS